MTKGKREGGSKHQLLWEEVPFLKFERRANPCRYLQAGERAEWSSVRAVQLLLLLRHPRDQSHAHVPSVAVREEALMRLQEVWRSSFGSSWRRDLLSSSRRLFKTLLRSC